MIKRRVSRFDEYNSNIYWTAMNILFVDSGVFDYSKNDFYNYFRHCFILPTSKFGYFFILTYKNNLLYYNLDLGSFVNDKILSAVVLAIYFKEIPEQIERPVNFSYYKDSIDNILKARGINLD